MSYINTINLFKQMDGGQEWNQEGAVRTTWDTSAGCTGIPELMFLPGFEPSTFRLKRHHVIH